MTILDDAIQLTELKCVTEDGGRYYVTPEGHQYPSTTTVVNWDKREFFAEWVSPLFGLTAEARATLGPLGCVPAALHLFLCIPAWL